MYLGYSLMDVRPVVFVASEPRRSKVLERMLDEDEEYMDGVIWDGSSSL